MGPPLDGPNLKDLKEKWNRRDRAGGEYVQALEEEIDRLWADGWILREEIERLRAELVEIKAYWEECQTEHHKRNLEVQNLKAEVETHLSDKVKLRAEIERLRAERDDG